MHKQIASLVLLSMLGCDDVTFPEQHDDFDTTGAAVFNSIADVDPSTGTGTGVTPAGTGTPSDTPSDPDTPSEVTPIESESEEDPSDEVPLDMHVDTPHACDGEVPVTCLQHIHDASHCTDGWQCEKSACTQRAFADARLAMMRCLESECGVEPAYDLDCVESWADLEESCLLEHCGVPGMPCTHMALWGWQAECLQ